MKPESEYILFATINGLPVSEELFFLYPNIPFLLTAAGLFGALKALCRPKKIVDAVLFVILRTK